MTFSQIVIMTSITRTAMLTMMAAMIYWLLKRMIMKNRMSLGIPWMRRM